MTATYGYLSLMRATIDCPEWETEEGEETIVAGKHPEVWMPRVYSEERDEVVGRRFERQALVELPERMKADDAFEWAEENQPEPLDEWFEDDADTEHDGEEIVTDGGTPEPGVDRKYICEKCDSIVRARWGQDGDGYPGYFAVGCDCTTVPVVPQMGQAETPVCWYVQRPECCRDVDVSELDTVNGGGVCDYRCPDCGATYRWDGTMSTAPDEEGGDGPSDGQCVLPDGGTPEPGVDRPKGCAACGLRAAVDPEEPADHETTFEVDRETEDSVVFECGFCETRTRVPKDPEPTVDCRNCGEPIPESLQGGHACETHPLGTAPTPDFSNPMEGYR